MADAQTFDLMLIEADGRHLDGAVVELARHGDGSIFTAEIRIPAPPATA